MRELKDSYAHVGDEFHIIFGQYYQTVVPFFINIAHLYICCNVSDKGYNEHFSSSVGFMENMVIFFETHIALSVFSSSDLHFVQIVL